MDLPLSISDGFVKSKIYDKRDVFDFDIVDFPFLDGNVPRLTSYGVYILNLFVLLECPVRSMNLILVIKFWFKRIYFDFLQHVSHITTCIFLGLERTNKIAYLVLLLKL